MWGRCRAADRCGVFLKCRTLLTANVSHVLTILTRGVVAVSAVDNASSTLYCISGLRWMMLSCASAL